MKRLIIFLLKPLSFLPALLMMYVIFSFSSQSGQVSGELSYKVSYHIVTIGAEILDKDISDMGVDYYIEQIHGPVRKAAHMTEYFLLAIAISFPFYVYGLRGFPLLVVAGIICFGFACTDEFHQSMVEGRGTLKTGCGHRLRGGILWNHCWFASSASPLCLAAAAKRKKGESAAVNLILHLTAL